eukprot:UN01186
MSSNIYLGTCDKTGNKVAIKFEKHTSHHPHLSYEYRIYHKLANDINDKISIPWAKAEYFGGCIENEERTIVMVMNCLGPSLDKLFTFCCNKFSLKTILLIVDKILEKIEYLHDKHFVHRDIRPSCFLLDSDYERKRNEIHIIKYGHAKRYFNPSTQQHDKYGERGMFSGFWSVQFASINAQQHYVYSRRDDLESIGYVLIHFLSGDNLPWKVD